MIIHRIVENVCGDIQIYQYNTKTDMERLIWSNYKLRINGRWIKYQTPYKSVKEKRISKSKAKELMFLESL